MADLVAAIQHFDVVAALARAPIRYGRDLRQVDGSVFAIIVDGRLVEVGAECAGATGCREIPAGVQALKTLLETIDREKELSACQQFKP